MSSRVTARLTARHLFRHWKSPPNHGFMIEVPYARSFSGLPESVKRVGASDVFPNEYPGQVYAFNWALNRDGVTPLNKSAFRITKLLDLKIAGLKQPKTNPLKVKAASEKEIPEAGSPKLPYSTYDTQIQSTKDALSQSPHLYCPEGHVPTTLTGVRVISNSSSIVPNLVAYLERAPKKDPPISMPITVYALENSDEEFAGYAIEEIDEFDKETGELGEPKSVAAVVVSGKKLKLEVIVAGIELSAQGLEADAKERAEAAKEKEDSA